VPPRTSAVEVRKRKTTEKAVVESPGTGSGVARPDADTVVDLKALDLSTRPPAGPAVVFEDTASRIPTVRDRGAQPDAVTIMSDRNTRSERPTTEEPVAPATPSQAGKQTAVVAPHIDSPSQIGQLYADGVGARGEVDGAQRTVSLPYKSTEVTFRIGRYDLLNELGRGGMGVVYRAYSLHLERFCAIKLMTAGMHAGEVATIRFQNEARIASCLKHPNIVSIFDSGVDDSGRLYFVMEFVEGMDLASFAAQSQDLAAIVQTIIRSARGLQYAHERGVVHRDIKPDNILVDSAGIPHITDFGIARREADVGLTQDGSAMGTPAYMSPEQANGEIATIGPATDIYSLGGTLYHALTGQAPFLGDSPLAIMVDVVTSDPAKPSVVARELGRIPVPADLETICLKALEKEASARYATMDAFADDLTAFLEDRPIAARPTGGTERLRKLIRRNKSAFVGATLIGVTLMVLTIAFGAVLIFNVERTSESLTLLDTEAGEDQATTLHKAIITNMLQGRADVVRELVKALREDETLASIEVVRPDRTYAYTDRSTRLRVERRINDASIMGPVLAERPEFVAKIEDLKRVGFGAIDDNFVEDGGTFEFDPADWKAILAKPGITTRVEEIDGKSVLSVFKPIKNSAKCTTCHGAIDDGGYDENSVRAVLVVRRSQDGLQAQISRNRVDTITIGVATAALLFFLAFVFVRLTGIGVPKRRFSSDS